MSSTTDQSRGMIKYTSRDYNSIMEDFWSIVPTLTELWKPEADADPGVVLGKVLASAADMLGVNVDWLANELFAPSVTQRKNAEKIFRLIGYELGWYTAARTEVTFTNESANAIEIDFGFNGSNFCTLNAYTDITNQSRVITYNILPKTNKYGASETRSRREVISTNIDIFAEHDKVQIGAGQSVTRVAIEGELRQDRVAVSDIKKNNYIINLSSQHIDTTAVWIKAETSSGQPVNTQWIQCANTAEFITPEPRFAVTYDNYSNAQIQISNYLNSMEDYESNYLVVYWIDCSGVIGCVGENVLRNLYLAQPGQNISTDGEISISNLSNTLELPHTNTITGRSPETAKEAYYNSRNYINTWDSLCTLPDFNRFLNREPGVDCGLVIDCQKALEINLAIYYDENLTDAQKSKMYINNNDFAAGDAIFDWNSILGFNPEDSDDYKFSATFKRYTAMCYAIHNDFLDSAYGQGDKGKSKKYQKTNYSLYKPPQQFIDDVIRDYRPLQTMSAEIEFGYARIFPFYVVGQIYTKKPVDDDNGKTIIENVKKALKLYFSPASRSFGAKPTVMEIVNVVQSADENILYFDAGSLTNPIITWTKCDPEYFNPISFAKFEDPGESATNIRIASECKVR